MGCVQCKTPRLRLHAHSCSLLAEDQQRINSFSNLNTRLRSIEEKIEAVKVRARLFVWSTHSWTLVGG